jgi:hypothetical protein
MTDFAKVTLNEAVHKAVTTKGEHDVRKAESLLRTLCARHKKSWLMYIFDDVLPTMEIATKQVVELKEIVCPYCEKPVKNIVGLKAHLGVKHKEFKSEWSLKY